MFSSLPSLSEYVGHVHAIVKSTEDDLLPNLLPVGWAYYPGMWESRRCINYFSKPWCRVLRSLSVKFIFGVDSIISFFQIYFFFFVDTIIFVPDFICMWIQKSFSSRFLKSVDKLKLISFLDICVSHPLSILYCLGTSNSSRNSSQFAPVSLFLFFI